MAKKRQSKTKAVMEYWKQNPTATAGQISEALSKMGVSVAPRYVANIKSANKKRGQAVRAVGEKRGLGVPEIKAALALLKASGSTDAAKEALAAAEEIRAMLA